MLLPDGKMFVNRLNLHELLVFLNTFVPLDISSNLREVLKLSEALAWSGVENQSLLHTVD